MKTAMLSTAPIVMACAPAFAQSSGGGVDPVALEANERELAYQLAPIKSDVDLRTYMTKSRGKDNPLNLLTPGARQRFVQSLVFTDKGLTSFDYRGIQAELSASQAYQLLQLFGAQRTTRAIRGLRADTPADFMILSWGDQHSVIGDYNNYYCRSRATCAGQVGSICIGANC